MAAVLLSREGFPSSYQSSFFVPCLPGLPNVPISLALGRVRALSTSCGKAAALENVKSYQRRSVAV